LLSLFFFFFFSSRRRHTRSDRDWSSDVCSSDLAAGTFVFSNLPPNPYHLVIEAQGFQRLERDVDVRSAVPITLDLTLALAGATRSEERRVGKECRVRGGPEQ